MDEGGGKGLSIGGFIKAFQTILETKHNNNNNNSIASREKLKWLI